MKSKKNHTKTRNWQKADPRVLGQILAAQNIEFALPDTTHIAEFYHEVLTTIPGVKSCCVCLDGGKIQKGSNAKEICLNCQACRTSADGFKCEWADQPGIQTTEIRSIRHHFGFFVFETRDLETFHIYSPFISNLTNYLAISLENRLQRDLLQNAHDELEHRVEERTRDLLAANASLQEEIESRRQLEKALIASERQVKQLVDASPVAMVVVSRGDQTIEWMNDKFTKLFGYNRADMPDVKHWWLLAYPDETYRAQIIAYWDHLRKNLIHDQKEIQVMEAPVTCKDGSQRYIEFCQSSIGEKDIVTFVDLTERKQAEESLKQMNERFSLATHAGKMGVWDWDIQKNELVWDDEMYRLYGVRREDFAGAYEAWLHGLHPEDRAASDEISQRARRGEQEYDTEFRVIWPDGSVHYLKAFGQIVRDANGQSIRMTGINFDITERKKAEEEIQKLNQELEKRVIERTVELESANQELEGFAYSVSHDLRAPLRHIDGFLELLQNRTAAILDEKSRHYLAVIADSAKRMGELIDDLLSFSRMGRSEIAKGEINLVELVQDVIMEFKPEAEGRDILWQIAPLPEITGDRAMLRMVLANLISNALKFTRTRAQTKIEIGWKTDHDSETIVFVRDNGVGFDMQYVDKLFGVFQRLHLEEDFEGTGIGLANVRRIIHRHGGRTWAEGEIDRGATFYFSLPQPEKGD